MAQKTNKPWGPIIGIAVVIGLVTGSIAWMNERPDPVRAPTPTKDYPQVTQISIPASDAPKDEWPNVKIPPGNQIWYEESATVFKTECEDIDSGKRIVICERARSVWHASTGDARTLHYYFKPVRN